MHHPRHQGPPPSGAPGSDFARLIETEAALEARLSRARDDARQLIQAARDEAAARDGALEQELAELRASSEMLIERERAGRAAVLLEQAGRETARLRAVGPDRVEELARHVVARLLGEASR